MAGAAELDASGGLPEASPVGLPGDLWVFGHTAHVGGYPEALDSASLTSNRGDWHGIETVGQRFMAAATATDAGP